MTSLGMIVINGEHREALDWLWVAAQLGNQPALTLLGQDTCMWGGMEKLIPHVDSLESDGSVKRCGGFKICLSGEILVVFSCMERCGYGSGLFLRA